MAYPARFYPPTDPSHLELKLDEFDFPSGYFLPKHSQPSCDYTVFTNVTLNPCLAKRSENSTSGITWSCAGKGVILLFRLPALVRCLQTYSDTNLASIQSVPLLPIHQVPVRLVGSDVPDID
ncbi:hypothetical protein I3760_03G082800 [Carya illinoinensis]|nr:hypothetical protein I3760_03G082800 [Carya illinoinensis]KAG2715536.1 hypothetical protein I3760_03G082800 [Carya illinoinensis]